MTRQVTDQLYIDLGYLTPEEYYNYIANAASEQTVTATVTAVLSNLQGADLFAFTEASLDATAEVIKSADAQLTTEVTATTSVSKIIEVSSALESSFAITADLTMAFVSAEASLVAELQLQVAYERIKETNIALASEFSVAIDFVRFVSADSFESAIFTVDTLNERSRDFNIETQAAFSVSADSLRIQEGAADFTGAFTPTLTVDVFKNSFAVLDCTTSLDVSATVTRDASSFESAIFNIAAINDRYRKFDIETQSAFSITANAEKFRFKTATANLITQAFESSVARVTPFRVPTAPHPFTAYNGARIVSDPVKFGTGALSIPTTGSYIISDYSTDFNIAGSSQFSLGFWYKATSGANNTLIRAQNRWSVDYVSGSSRLYFYLTDSNNFQYNTYAIGVTLSTTDYQWIVIQRYFTGVMWKIRIYINGSLVTESGSFGYGTKTDGTYLTIGSETNNQSCIGYYDGIMWDNASINNIPTSAPSGEYTTANGCDLLLNFNGSSLDQSGAQLESGQAALASAFSLSAKLTGPTKYSANLTATTSLVCNAVEVPEEAQANLEVTTELALTGLRIKDAASAQSSEFTQSADAVATRTLDAAITATTELLASTYEIQSYEYHMQSEFSQTAVGVKITDIVSNQNAESEQTTSAERLRDNAITSTATTALTASAQTVAATSANLTATTSTDAQALRIQSGEIHTDAIFSELTIAYRVADFFIVCESNFVQTTDGTITTGSVANLTVDSTLITANDRLRSAASNTSADTQLSVVVEKNIIGQAYLTVDSALTANVVETDDFVIHMAADTALTATPSKFEINEIAMVVEPTISITADRIRFATVTEQVNTELTSQVSKTVEAAAELTAFYSQMIIVTVTVLDPNLTWIVPRELRSYRIAAENRNYIIERENRSYLIRNY